MPEARRSAPDTLKSPPIYSNWRAALDGAASHGVYEFALYTDAHITGEITEGCGPYQFLNLVPGLNEYGVAKPTITVRVERHLSGPALEVKPKTDDELYHGGWINDEIAALVSLSLGIRVKAGGVTRDFQPNGDPRGRPIGWGATVPLLAKNSMGEVLPRASQTHSLNDELKPLADLPKIAPADAIVLIRAARLYQEGLWAAEAAPEYSWLMLVSAAETCAGRWQTQEDSPLERLRAAMPDLVVILEEVGVAGLSERVAEKLANLVGSTKKFLDFLREHLPAPPEKRPLTWACVTWEDLPRVLKLVYHYRSRALHGGRPFPAPMCTPPWPRIPECDVPPEKPTGRSTAMLGGSWEADDVPIFLHTFEHIVRGALLRWWDSRARRAGTVRAARSAFS